jgi:hypothetical protein
MPTHEEVIIKKEEAAQTILPYIIQLRADYASGKLLYSN